MALYHSVKRWLGFDRSIGLHVRHKPIRIYMTYPSPQAIRRSERVVALAKSPWTLSIVSGLFGAFATKLIDLL